MSAVQTTSRSAASRTLLVTLAAFLSACPPAADTLPTGPAFTQTSAAAAVLDPATAEPLETAAREHTPTVEELQLVTGFLYIAISARVDGPSLAYADPEMLDGLELIAAEYPTYFRRSPAAAPLISTESDYRGRCGVSCVPSSELISNSVAHLTDYAFEGVLPDTSLLARAHHIADVVSQAKQLGASTLAALRREVTPTDVSELVHLIASNAGRAGAILGASEAALGALTAITACAAAFTAGYELGTIGYLVADCMLEQRRCPSDAGSSDAGLGDPDAEAVDAFFLAVDAGSAMPACASLRCDDGVACTRDSCELPGTCIYVPDDALCGVGMFCDVAAGGCS